MVRGPRKHLKRIAAPKHWMLDKMGGAYTVRPSGGPHKLRECLPLVLLLRNRLKYALTRREVMYIARQRLVKVDGRIRIDPRYPTGFMDVVSLDKTGEHFRMLYDEKGRFTVHRITPEEAKFKLCRVTKLSMARGGVPYLVTADSRTIRYPDPKICVNDSVKIDLATGRIVDFVRFEVGNLCMTTGGSNTGRVGTIARREKHPGSFEIVHIKDAAGHAFSTRLTNVFVIGKTNNSLVSLPRGKGVKLSIIEERAQRDARALKHASRSQKN
jgi:small subunit ribosomal protein S4e